MTVGVLVRDPVGRARIQDALRGFARVALCEREADLLTMLGNATVSVIVRGHDTSLDPSPLPRIGSMQLVHGVNAEDPQTRRQDALRGGDQGDTSTR